MDAASKTSAPATTSVAVWDPVVRIGHWVLVAAVAIAYFSAEEEGGSPEPLHVWGGYVVGAIVVLRILWGFCRAQLRPLQRFRLRADRRRQISYRPSRRACAPLSRSQPGGRSDGDRVACLFAGTVATGVVAYGERGKGPLAADGAVITTVAHAEENEGGAGEAKGAEGRKSIVAEVHGALANITLALVVLHVLGVGLTSYAHRENSSPRC